MWLSPFHYRTGYHPFLKWKMFKRENIKPVCHLTCVPHTGKRVLKSSIWTFLYFYVERFYTTSSHMRGSVFLRGAPLHHIFWCLTYILSTLYSIVNNNIHYSVKILFEHGLRGESWLKSIDLSRLTATLRELCFRLTVPLTMFYSATT